MSFPQMNQTSTWDFGNPMASAAERRTLAFNNGINALRRNYRSSRRASRPYQHDVEPWVMGWGSGYGNPPAPSEMDPYDYNDLYRTQRRNRRAGSVPAPVDYNALGMQPPGQPQMQHAGPQPLDPYDQVDPYGGGMYNLNVYRDQQAARHPSSSVFPPSSVYRPGQANPRVSVYPPTGASPSEPECISLGDLRWAEQDSEYMPSNATNTNVSQLTGYMNGTNSDGESHWQLAVDPQVQDQRMQDYLMGRGPAMAGGPTAYWADTCSDSGPRRVPGRRLGGGRGGGPPNGGWSFDF